MTFRAGGRINSLRPLSCSLEQFVYGSFAFWDRGYDVLARSPACRPEWVSGALVACRRYGEAPAGVEPAPGMFAIRLGSGPWAIVGVGPQGSDDRGRPGALAFHALIVAARDYRRAGSDPFAFAGALRRDWAAGTTLEALTWSVEPTAKVAGPPTDPRALPIARALIRGRRVALKAEGPAEALAREVWASLPEPTRRRASVATWAFGNGNRFDLVALPRLEGVEADRSYIDPATLDAGSSAPSSPHPLSKERLSSSGLAALGVAAALLAAGLGWRAMTGPGRADPPVALAPAEPFPAAPEAMIGPVDREEIAAGLAELAERFEAFEVGGPSDPSAFLARFSEQVRYRGPVLSPAELARLSAESDPDRDRALAWHDRIKAFGEDRPLPADFAIAPLSRQLRDLARSFGIDPPARPGAILDALAGSLGRDGPVRPTPLAVRYPALSEYARFLGRLPRRGNAPGGR